nr:hypothetical protein [Tanacetum cinerariifolium]
MSIQDMEDLKQQHLDEMKSLINSEYCNEIKINELKGNFNGMSIEINKKKKLQQLELVANLMREYYKNSPVAITRDFSITDSLIIEDEHLDTISETESDELIKSSVKNLVPSPSNDDESFFDENVPNKVYSNPLFEEEIISTMIDLHHFNIESVLIESFLNQDSSIISSPKNDSLLEEFSGKLAHIDLIPPGINETDFDPEEKICLVERLLYDNLSPRPPKEPNSKNSDVVIESFSLSPIPVEDSDSLMEEIDLFLTLDDSMPPGIENDDYDSEGDILFFEELLSNNSLHFLKMSQLFWGFEVKVVGCGREQWEWRETGGLGFTGFGGKFVVGEQWMHSNLNVRGDRLRKNTTQSTQYSKIFDLIGEIIPCSDLSSRNVPALSAKCLGF